MTNRVKEAGIVRARGNAHSAAYALPVVHDHHAVFFPSHRGLYRAYLHTGWNVTLIAEAPEEMVGGIREVALLYPFDPGAPVTQRDIIFALARDGAAVAADAPSLIH
jgi:hypothetical protein